MVRIRLRRVGRKKQPSYRIVVADSRSPRDGRYIEVIGFYNPRTQPTTMTIKEERALHWLSNGAQPSDPVRRILDKLGTLARFERLRQGEPVEELVAEAEQQFAEAGLPSPRTSYAPHEIQRPTPVKQQPAAKAEAQEEPVEAEAAAETEEAVEAEQMADVQDSPTPEAAKEAAELAETESLPDEDSDAKPDVAEVGETSDEADEVDEAEADEAEEVEETTEPPAAE